MTTEQSPTIVLRDEAGNLYVLTPELLAQARVSDERKAEVERALTGDVAGFGSGPVYVPLPAILPYTPNLYNPNPPAAQYGTAGASGPTPPLTSGGVGPTRTSP